MNTRQMDDSVFEALFHQAVIDDYNEEIDSIPPIEKLMRIISFSPEFELRMKKVFAREQQKYFLKIVLYYGKRAAAVIIVITSVLFGILLFNSEVRAAIKNVVVEWYDRFTSFIFHAETSLIDDKNNWQPEYIPTGYYMNSVEKLGKTTNIEYVNDAGDMICLSYRPEGVGTNISVDNENHILESEIINGYEVYIAKAKNDDFDNGVIWSMKGYTFSIWSKLPIYELIKVVQSIY